MVKIAPSILSANILEIESETILVDKDLHLKNRYPGQISGGERQRLVLARALYNNPDILILDEATSSLDKSNEEKIINDIFLNLKNVTIITISHNMDSLKYCNKIYKMENGSLIKDF